MASTRTEFCIWLQTLLRQRRWSQADLARRCGLSEAQISRLVNNLRQPGGDACLEIARAADLSVDHVCRVADLLPPAPEPDAPSQELLRLLVRLPPARQDDLLTLARRWAEPPIPPQESPP